MPKEGIHPSYNNINVKCACGSNFETRSTNKGDIVVEICAACHPFFTGEQRIVDTAGQVERFMNKLGSAQEGGAVSKKQVRREQMMAETQRARTFTPQLEALAKTGDIPAEAATPTA